MRPQGRAVEGRTPTRGCYRAERMAVVREKRVVVGLGDLAKVRARCNHVRPGAERCCGAEVVFALADKTKLPRVCPACGEEWISQWPDGQLSSEEVLLAAAREILSGRHPVGRSPAPVTLRFEIADD